MSKVKIALEDLFVPGGQGVRAHSKGDEVAADTKADLKRIEKAGWADLVADPEPTESAADEATDTDDSVKGA